MSCIRYIPDGKQMKQIDSYTINEKKIPSVVLMERASLAVCDVISALDKKNILCVCSTGNNGADGLCCARILKIRGYNTAICITGDINKATEEFKLQYEICKNINIPVVNLTCIDEYDVVVDALFGIGLSRNIEGIYKEVIDAVNESKKMIVSIDMPSGIDPSTGAVLGTAVRAAHTVTFGYAKRGLTFYPGKIYAGDIHVAEDVGFICDDMENPDIAWTFDKNGYSKLLPLRRPDSNKGTYGKVLILSGSEKMAGASYFSAGAAYRTGAGMVKVLTHSSNKDIVLSKLPEALIDFYDNIDRNEFYKMLDWADVIVAGPGLSTGTKQTALIKWLLEYDNILDKKAVVADADALNIISQNKWQKLLKDMIITPHMGEMSRLFNIPVTVLKEDNALYCKKFAEAYGCICVLKDAVTTVSEGSRLYINTNGNSGMSTAGSGDVLTGILAGLLAQGMDKYMGACMGVWLHGMSGDFAAREHGEYSMNAGDMIFQIEKTINN